MENQTRFDLNIAIENWRNELAAQPNFSADDRRELETHLRDTITGLRQRGLNDEETFWLARRRIGQPQQLGEEFVKADPSKAWRERAFWIVASIVIFQIVKSVTHCLFAVLTVPLHIDYRFQGLFLAVESLFNTLPVIYITVLIATGRMARLICKLSLVLYSQARLGSVAAALVIISSLLNSFGDWIKFRMNLPNAAQGLPIGSLLNMTTLLYMVYPLVLVGLLIWLMPTQNQKTPKRA